MVELPDEMTLIAHVRNSLDAVAARHRQSEIATADWFPQIASEIALRVQPLNLRCYARGKRRGEPATGCVGSEWLFDFCALIEDTAVEVDDRFMAQAAIVGEIEWGANGIDQDFEKLLIVDSLVCFMAFQQWSKEDAVAALTRLSRAVALRQGYARQRGMARPPAFVLSCLVVESHCFIHWPETAQQ